MDKPNLTRKKVGDQSYVLLDEKGREVATAVRTGTHLDYYPWDWALSDDLAAQLKVKSPKTKAQGVEESLRVCVETIAGRIAQYELEVK